MRSPRATAPWVALPLLALCALAGTPRAWGEVEGPAVALRTLTLSRVEGRLVSLDTESLTLRSPVAAAPRTFRLDEVIALDVAGRASPPPKEPAAEGSPRFRAHLVGGSRLLGRYVGPAPDGLVLEVAGLGPVTLSFEQVLTLEEWPVDAAPCRKVAEGYPRPEADDVAYDARGDKVRGTVTKATADALHLETDRGRTLEVAWRDLRLLYLENDALGAPAGLACEIQLADGSRLAATSLTADAEGLHARLRELPKVAFVLPFDGVRTVRWSGGTFVYASTLPFESKREHYYEGPGDLAPYFDQLFGTRVDGRLSGCPLRIGGETFRHGFGVFSHNTITLPLEGAYASFRASFGIDDEVLAGRPDGEERGYVDARVLGDGKVLWEAKGVRGGEKVRRLGPLDVRGVKTLVLEVGFGDDSYTFDRADWGDPILVKK